ncbi:uncharacterized protein CCR75_003018 [Bremia lactucae]|uniref:HSF-type DNA-binding domain-containing protein n=1 Tax=Bremia lactucae TaxID=4779 RepID=A0A976IJY5_BRELC|nr:hypothetical protein CCR75_003018 [Bremia lactucae]
MAKRIRATKQEGFAPASAVSSDLAKSAPKSTHTCSDGKHVMLPAFLSKTYEIFSMPEFLQVCGWNANGDTIIVSQLETFVATVLPRFFKHRNFPSFVRQLNLYGFHKTVLDSKRLEFQHPYFKRGRPDLLHHIKRKVSTGTSNNQQLVSSSIQNSRLDAHREISDTLLREMKDLRQRSDIMEKRLRELEIDNAIVRSDNIKLWKHLEQSKDKQMIMQVKMKKIMWILFQIYRGKQQTLPKLSGNDGTGAVITEDYANSSMLGPKEFRDVLRFLAIDEPPLLPGSNANVSNAASASRKRKFVERWFSIQIRYIENIFQPVSLLTSCVVSDAEPYSLFQMPNALEESNPFAMTVQQSSSPSLAADGEQTNVLSIFSPITNVVNNCLPNIDASLGNFLSNNEETSRVSSPPVSSPVTSASTTPVSTAPTQAVSTPIKSSPPTNNEIHTQDGIEVVLNNIASSGQPDANNQLAFLDEDLPLLPDTGHYSFTDGEQAVMRKLEDFETSLLDEYDVSCLDTLLQQLKNSGGDKLSGVTVADAEEVVVGPANPSMHEA